MNPPAGLRVARAAAVLAGLVLGLASSSAGEDPASFTVGTATATPGLKATGVLEVPAGVDAGLAIPVAVVRGTRPGPVLALVSGAHGTEYASIIAVEKLIERLDPAQVSGTVILVPLVNTPFFEQKVPHVNPVDGKSMNRFYPGRVDGTQTERALFVITRQVVERCDDLIDFHGGDLDEDLRPYSYDPLVARGTYVAEGMKVGYMTDYLGRKVFEARAPAAGVVLYVCSVPSMRKGETIASIGLVSLGSPAEPK
jgi:predicted deacylase